MRQLLTSLEKGSLKSLRMIGKTRLVPGESRVMHDCNVYVAEATPGDMPGIYQGNRNGVLQAKQRRAESLQGQCWCHGP